MSQPDNTLISAPLFDSPYANQFIDAAPSIRIFDSGALQPSAEVNNGTFLSSSIHLSSMESLSPGSYIDSDPLPPSDTTEENQYQDDTLHQYAKEHLANLPRSVLKGISKNVAEALLISNQKEQKNPLDFRGDILEVPARKALQNASTTPSTVHNVYKCEHPGCKTTFRHNKDRLRHFRQKHTTSTKAFSCPVVHCPTGHGHKFHRSDKLRDHLRSVKISCFIHWACVLPDCSEIARGKTGLIDHLGQHDYETRKKHSRLLRDYGLASSWSCDYFWAGHICNVQGCPFGTDDKDAMDHHLSIPHEGPFCPCPIPNCGAVSRDWESASNHLTREHDYTSKESFKDEIHKQHLRRDGIFVCPICSHEVEYAGQFKVRNHCQKHSYQQLLQASTALLHAWTFCLGPKVELRFDLWKVTLTGDEILAYIILPSEELEKSCNKADFEQAGAKLRASIELSKGEP